jgi:hypothetical protein
MAFGNRPLPCTLRNTNGRPLAGGLAPAAVDQANHGNCCNGHRENHPGDAERSVVGKNPFQSEGQIDRIEQRVAGRHAKLGGRFKTTSSTGENRSVIRSKSGRQDLNLRPLDPQPLPAGLARNPGTPIFLHHNASRAHVQTFDPLTLFMHRLHVYWVNFWGRPHKVFDL